MEDAVIMTKHRHTSINSLLAAMVLFLFATSSQAAVIFTGQNIDVTFSEPGFSNLSDTVVAGAGVELNANVNSLSQIERFAMIDFESIDIEETSILFTLRGDGADFGAFNNILFQDTGTRSGATYILALSGAPFSIDSVSIGDTNNVMNLSPTDVSVIGGAIHFDISQLAIGTINNAADLGTIRLNVGFVPIPAALPLMLSGLAGLLVVCRRRKLTQ
jgi:hypothetical protein